MMMLCAKKGAISTTADKSVLLDLSTLRLITYANAHRDSGVRRTFARWTHEYARLKKAFDETPARRVHIAGPGDI